VPISCACLDSIATNTALRCMPQLKREATSIGPVTAGGSHWQRQLDCNHASHKLPHSFSD
jgi:hypothetical protein